MTSKESYRASRMPKLGQKFGNYTVISTEVRWVKPHAKILVSCPHNPDGVWRSLTLLLHKNVGCRKCRNDRDRVWTEDRQKHRARISNIFKRCYKEHSPDFKNYGAKGVRVWDGFHDKLAFADFLVQLPGYFEGADLDRINPFLGYEPGNLRWATRSENMLNTRRHYGKKANS